MWADIPFFCLGPDKPRLLTQTTDFLVVSYTNLNDSHWEYLYNASALSPDSVAYEGECNLTSNTCTFSELSPGTQYSITMQAFMPSAEANPPAGSEVSEPLMAYTITEG